MKQEIINCLTWLTNRVSESVIYENWSDGIRAEENNEAFEMFYEEIKKRIDFAKLTKTEAKELRFKQWEDDQPDLFLFPLWLTPIIPEGMEVYNLDGSPFEYHKETADIDIRFGCVPFGLMLND